VRLPRFVRVTGLISSTVRVNRWAEALLIGRLGWLLTLTVPVVVAASQVVVVIGAGLRPFPAGS
jgi:voltage-gated potassium channel